MIQYFKTIQNRLTEIETVEKDCWINVVNPTTREIDYLSNKLLIPSDLINDPLDVDENARIEQEKNCMLIVFRVPLELNKQDLPYTTISMGIILKRDLIVTVCSKPIEVVQAFVESRVRGLYTEKRERFVLQLFLRSSVLFLRYLKNINGKADELQITLNRSTRNEELMQLLNFEKSLVYFNTSLKSNELMMHRLQRMKIPALDREEEQDLIEDVMTETKQAIDMAHIYTDILGNLMSAHSSIISNNLNITIRFLTSVTIILSLPILVASLYGMNVPLPFQDHPHAFWIVMCIATLLSVLGVAFFRKKNLF
ncbi:MAG: magnesium transporter CorA family protein [Bacteroidia bacterium]|jgi:magnesium transporter